MAGIGPIAGLEKNSLEQPDLDHLTADSIDFNPITYADAIASHENEPSEKGHDEVFHGYGQAGTGETEDGCSLCGHSDDDEQDDKCSYGLNSEFCDRTQSVDPLILG